MSSDITSKWGAVERTPTVQHFHNRIRQTVAARKRELAGTWASAAPEHDGLLLTATDIEGFESELLAQGYRFDCSATVSQREAPEKYKSKAAAQIDDAEIDEQGRQKVGEGDNLVQGPANVQGIARFISTLEEVTNLLMEGVPPDTVAVIDDSGGTLTAPILEEFKAVICLGGTVRSHLGILTREYGIPCFMNCQLGPALKNGDAVEMETTAPAVAGSDYESGTAHRARIWKRPGAPA